MFLSDADIRQAVEDGTITLKDFDPKRLQQVSYDILLGNRFIVTEPHETDFIDPSKKVFPKTKEINVENGGKFILHPGVMVLGTTIDYVGSKNYLIQISGKSSLARIGLIVHNTAGIINPGHFLNITLELCNLNAVPIILRPGMEIAQLTFSKMTQPVSRDYQKTGRFNGDNWSKNFALPKKK